MFGTILALLEKCVDTAGGAELATYTLFNVLKELFHINVLSGCSDPIKIPKITYIYEPFLSEREKIFTWLNIYFLRLFKKSCVTKLIAKVDLVYIPRFAFPIIPLARSMRKRVVVHLHDYIAISGNAAVLAPYEKHKNYIVKDTFSIECRRGLATCLGAFLFNWWSHRLVRRWLRDADSIICVSKRHAQIIGELVPELRDRITVIYNPLPQDLKNTSSKNLGSVPVFLYAGGDNFTKGFNILVEALEILRTPTRVKFMLVNRYSDKALRRLRRAVSKNSYIELEVLGRVSREELVNLHRNVWALVFPSIWEEPLPYAVYESMALGTIPVAARVGGVPELLEGTRGARFMFKPWSAEELANRIEEVASMEPSEVVELGEEISSKAWTLSRQAENAIVKHFIDLSSGS